ncbi:MAG: immunoglobulin domain-containing protein [Verrucomicrobiae bacterium]|nr:immunoglobulin domain-containing protein [Verrucomicrobiae bacterium]
MSYRLKNHSLLLAALLQVLPMVRTVCTQPSAVSAFAIIFRWAIGGTAALGAFDSVSGATSVFTSPSTFNGSVGTYFSNNVVVSIGGGNNASSSDYVFVSSGSTSSPLLYNNQTTTITMPPGLTFKASSVNGSKTIGGSIYGTPATPGSYPTTVTIVSPGNASLSQAITINITGTVTPTVPGITTQPSGTNVIVGRNAVFTVAASGTAPLSYAWSKNNSALTDGGNLSGSGSATLTVANVSAGDAGNYSVTVANTVGSATSSNASLAVILPPAIIAQPQGQTAAATGTASFTVTATGTGTLGYFWLKNGAALANGAKYSGVNTSALAISSIATADAGNYSVIVSNLAGTVTSSNATLAVVTSPTISAQPINRSVAAGTGVSFTVTAAGSSPLYFFWQKNGGPLTDGGNISGTTTATLNLSNVTTTDAAAYSVIVSNSLGSVVSSNATLAVLVPAGIVTSPAGVITPAGSNITFTVTADGSAPLTFTWRKNGSPLANGGNISGANTTTLALANVTMNDAGNYSVTVSNAVGGAVSSAASLTVLIPPTINTQPINSTVSSGATVTFSVNISGTAPLNLQWSKNGSALADGGNLSGSGSNILTLTSVTTNDAAAYSVIVSNSLGSVVSSNALLTVLVPASIVTSPASVTAVAASNISFTVTASGTAPLTFAWRKNGSPLANGGNISGADTATLSLANVTASDAGNYSVAVSNAVGGAVSSAANLTVLIPPTINSQPQNSTASSGANAVFTVSVSGTAPLSLQWYKNGSALVDGGNLSGSSSNILTLTGVTTNDAASYSVTISNSAGNTNSLAATLTVIVPPSIITPPMPTTVITTSNATFSVMVDGTAPFTYQWRKNGTNIAGANTATLTLTSVTAASAGNYSVVVGNSAGNVTSTDAALTVLAPPGIISQPVNQVSALGNSVSLSVVAGGTGPLSYQWFKGGIALPDGGNFSGALSNVLTMATLTTNEVDVYFVVISNFLGSVTSSNASIAVNVAPMITVQPASQIAARSNAVAFSVTATGTGPLAYQWRKNGTNISGATAATLTLINVTTNQNGNYSVRVTNVFGSTLSSNASLAIFAPPQIIASPTNHTAILGTNVSFAANVKGTAPLIYQWLKNGIPLVNSGNISGAASNVLKISPITTADAASYSVTVSNLIGSATSAGATLTVLVPPAIVTQPASQTVILSNAVTFTAGATGSAALRFQWRKAGTPIPGATNASFAIGGVKTNDAAAYSVVVTNLAGSITSSKAQLTVLVGPRFTLQATNRAAKVATTTIFKASVSGTAPVVFQWSKNGVALTDGGNISGSFSNVLTIANVTTNDGGAYFLTASNLAGVATSSNALLKILSPPVIVKQIGDSFAVISNSATMTIAAIGTAPMHYQWRKAGTAIAGATNASYVIAHVKTNDAAAYSVLVTNLAGTVLSSNGVLTVLVPPTFTLQASNRTARLNSATVFRAAVNGTAPFSFQWFKNGAPLADDANTFGSQSNILTLTSLTQTRAGAYSLSVTNIAGGITSSNATLSIRGRSGDGGGETDDRSANASVLIKAPAASLVTTPPPLIIAQISLNGNGSITLHCSGVAKTDYVLQSTSDFAQWTGIATNTADATGTWQVTDPMDAPVKFYRILTAR